MSAVEALEASIEREEAMQAEAREPWVREDQEAEQRMPRAKWCRRLKPGTDLAGSGPVQLGDYEWTYWRLANDEFGEPKWTAHPQQGPPIVKDIPTLRYDPWSVSMYHWRGSRLLAYGPPRDVTFGRRERDRSKVTNMLQQPQPGREHQDIGEVPFDSTVVQQPWKQKVKINNYDGLFGNLWWRPPPGEEESVSIQRKYLLVEWGMPDDPRKVAYLDTRHEDDPGPQPTGNFGNVRPRIPQDYNPQTAILRYGYDFGHGEVRELSHQHSTWLERSDQTDVRIDGDFSSDFAEYQSEEPVAKCEFASEECVICFEKLESEDDPDARHCLQRCGHTFHTACLRAWLQGNRMHGCPLCKADVNKADRRELLVLNEDMMVVPKFRSDAKFEMVPVSRNSTDEPQQFDWQNPEKISWEETGVKCPRATQLERGQHSWNFFSWWDELGHPNGQNEFVVGWT